MPRIHLGNLLEKLEEHLADLHNYINCIYLHTISANTS